MVGARCVDHDPCVWKTIDDEEISFTNPLQELKPSDLSNAIVGDECNTVGGASVAPGSAKPNFEFKTRKNASPSFPGPAKDELVANDIPNNDEGEELYADYSRFKNKKKLAYGNARIVMTLISLIS